MKSNPTNATPFERYQKIKIRKWAFLPIIGISEKGSEEIRDQLIASGILNSNFYLKKGIDLDDDLLNLGLAGKYQDYKQQTNRLKNRVKEIVSGHNVEPLDLSKDKKITQYLESISSF